MHPDHRFAQFIQVEPQPLSTTLRRGWQGRCPNCGGGPLLRPDLHLHTRCPACHEPLPVAHLTRPALFLTLALAVALSVLGHGAALHLIRPTPVTLLTTFGVATAALALFLLPRLRGLLLALRWSHRPPDSQREDP